MDTNQRTRSGDAQQRRRASAASGQAQKTAQNRARSRGTPSGTASRQRSGTAQPQKRRRAPVNTAAAQRTRSGSSQTPRRRTQKKKSVAPQIVYTPAKPFSRGRLLIQLATVVAVVLALTFGISIFFKVQTITVSGADAYSAWTVREASGIEQGDNLLTFGKMRARVNILAELPYVESVQIGIKLPDTVNIEIKEYDVVYTIQDQDKNWWVINSDGKVIEKTNIATAGEYTQVLGIQLSMPAANQQAVAVEPLPSQTDGAGQTMPVTVKGSERLNTALTILQYLEDNEIIGQIVSVDVTDISRIELWYEDRYQVNLGDSTDLSYKIKCLKGVVTQMDVYQTGVLDISFTQWPDEVGYTPFP